jgi:2-polyprenyl-6-hydroxyphenyl methylase/3-demethylubiquinone-9 3-methyltransferase
MKTHHELRELHGHEYVERFENSQRPTRLRRILEMVAIEPQDRVVDYACGSGMLMMHVAPLAKSYVGVDFSQPFIDRANTKKTSFGMENARFECSTIQEFGKKNQASFDSAFAMDISEHVYDEEWLDILISIRASLRTDGKLYLHTPNARFFLEIMKKHNFILRQFPEHIAVRTPEANIKLLEKAGFRISKVRLIPHYNVMRFLHPLSFIPFFGAYFQARIFIVAINQHFETPD